MEHAFTPLGATASHYLTSLSRVTATVPPPGDLTHASVQRISRDRRPGGRGPRADGRDGRRPLARPSVRRVVRAGRPGHRLRDRHRRRGIQVIATAHTAPVFATCSGALFDRFADDEALLCTSAPSGGSGSSESAPSTEDVSGARPALVNACIASASAARILTGAGLTMAGAAFVIPQIDRLPRAGRRRHSLAG